MEHEAFSDWTSEENGPVKNEETKPSPTRYDGKSRQDINELHMQANCVSLPEKVVDSSKENLIRNTVEQHHCRGNGTSQINGK